MPCSWCDNTLLDLVGGGVRNVSRLLLACITEQHVLSDANCAQGLQAKLCFRFVIRFYCED